MSEIALVHLFASAFVVRCNSGVRRTDNIMESLDTHTVTVYLEPISQRDSPHVRKRISVKLTS